MDNKNQKNANRILYSCKCDKGKFRENNEDNFYVCGTYLESDNEGQKNTITEEITQSISDNHGILLAVFDGMGGTQYGEIAAYEAAKSIDELMLNCENTESDETTMLSKLCMGINERVYMAVEKMGVSVMGTTMAALYFRSDKVWSCNVGDSRCYRLRRDVLEMISEDHVEELYYIDRVNKNRKPAIIQYLGMNPEEILIEPTINSSDLKEGDRYLICSDGLTDMVAEADITAILRDADDTEEAANKLVDLALANGGRDNITVIVCQC